ncbi:hypothetical protein [Microbispora sp. H10836]|uniref:hypothetical protein n=1 Tax=Microbispora sp. H10836 TaxID=2729106 RepID=UPI0014735CD6|nr:hypothetical protein [Microbispora sp. H10836]
MLVTAVFIRFFRSFNFDYLDQGRDEPQHNRRKPQASNQEQIKNSKELSPKGMN